MSASATQGGNNKYCKLQRT